MKISLQHFVSKNLDGLFCLEKHASPTLKSSRYKSHQLFDSIETLSDGVERLVCGTIAEIHQQNFRDYFFHDWEKMDRNNLKTVSLAIYSRGSSDIINGGRLDAIFAKGSLDYDLFPLQPSAVPKLHLNIFSPSAFSTDLSSDELEVLKTQALRTISEFVLPSYCPNYYRTYVPRKHM